MTQDDGFVRDQVARRYEQFMRDHHGELDVPGLCETMWSAGGRESIEAMVEFSDLVPMLRRVEASVRRIRQMAEEAKRG